MKKVILILAVISTTLLSQSNPVVSDVSVSMVGTTVTVNYKVASNQVNVLIGMKVSSDGGSTWTFNYGTASGDIGTVAVGDGNKQITWTLSGGNPEVVVMITVNDGQVGGANCGTVEHGGKTYNTIIIGDRCWLKENLNIGLRIDGTSEQTNNGTIEKYCYNNSDANCNTYGGLYQWNEAMAYAGPQGICPIHWHIPTYAEFQTLSNFTGGDGYSLHISDGLGGTPGTNTSGFSALFGGDRDFSGNYFESLSIYAFLWSSSEDGESGRYLLLNSSNSDITPSATNKAYGFSVRCVKDETVSSFLQLTSPNGGENREVGSSQNITWTSSGIINVKLEYTTNNGTNWTTIENSTPASTGSYSWTVPGTPSANAKVRISNVLNSGESDLSDAVFAINCPATITYSEKTYNIVQIGAQCWLKENLDIGLKINGSVSQSNNSTLEKYCYNDDDANCITYGGLYQWDEAMQYVTSSGAQGICPIGWHIPTSAEFQTLSTSVGGDGNSLKAVGQGTGAGAGTNTSGFSALLGGDRHFSGNYFESSGVYTFLWSSSEDVASARYLLLNNSNSDITPSATNTAYGFSVRCVMNE